jgi:hypothetical protein
LAKPLGAVGEAKLSKLAQKKVPQKLRKNTRKKKAKLGYCQTKSDKGSAGTPGHKQLLYSLSAIRNSAMFVTLSGRWLVRNAAYA